jgi:biotin-[acetyl-CoA-carboxylase] ligase BirA-like protein
MSNFKLLRFDSLDSTNEEAKRLLNREAIHTPHIICAKAQTAGKGTQGRKWISPEGAGLYFSIVHPSEALQVTPLTPLLTIAAGLACATTIAELTQLKIQLKPVNDLYLEGRKLGGILVESLISGGQCRGIITGIGINILKHREVIAGCEEETRGNHPISLQEGMAPLVFSQWQPGQIADELMLQIARQVDREYESLRQGNTDRLLEAYMQYKIPEYPIPAELAAALAERV